MLKAIGISILQRRVRREGGTAGIGNECGVLLHTDGTTHRLHGFGCATQDVGVATLRLVIDTIFEDCKQYPDSEPEAPAAILCQDVDWETGLVTDKSSRATDST